MRIRLGRNLFHLPEQFAEGPIPSTSIERTSVLTKNQSIPQALYVCSGDRRAHIDAPLSRVAG